MADVPSRFIRELTSTERQELAHLCRERPKAVGLRTTIIRLSAQRVPILEIMRKLNVSRPTVTAWLHRFEESGVSGLLTRSRPGRRPKLTPDVQRQIALVASSRPRDVGVQSASWSLPKLREYLVRTGIVPALSLESLRIAFAKRRAQSQDRPNGNDPGGDNHDPWRF